MAFATLRYRTGANEAKSIESEGKALDGGLESSALEAGAIAGFAPAAAAERVA